jgi:phage-related protein
LTGNTEIEDSLDRLDKLTVEEMRMASAELLKITNNVDGNVRDVCGNVQGIGGDVKDISSEVREVNRSLFLLHLLTVPRT